MSTYNRRGTEQNRNTNPPPPPFEEKNEGSENSIRVDGFEQVLAMLKIADSEFRDSLLRRLAARDKELAASLMRELRAAGIR